MRWVVYGLISCFSFYIILNKMKIEDEIKQSTFRDPYQKLVINMLFTSNWLQTKSLDFFKSFGITPQQFNILRILRGQHPKSISPTLIKERMLDKNSDVSRMLDRLVVKKLIIKQVCPKDKRAFDVSISKEGLELMKSMDKHLPDQEKITNLTEAEALQLSDLLDKMRG